MIKQVRDSNGNVVREFSPKVNRRVVDRRTARDLTGALVQVVSKEGTATRAAIPGFVVAGKTGTAQKIVDGQYVHDQFVSSFSGYFPAFDPQVCIFVLFDHPKGKDLYGGAVAAPVFRKMATRIASYLRIKPDQDIANDRIGHDTIQAAYQGGTP
jgi:cell division protein FtsI (penicillin-binding protein 3)/stage V sporulation protein D (sporulation-specific penicillin-binding protein)